MVLQIKRFIFKCRDFTLIVCSFQFSTCNSSFIVKVHAETYLFLYEAPKEIRAIYFDQNFGRFIKRYLLILHLSVQTVAATVSTRTVSLQILNFCFSLCF